MNVVIDGVRYVPYVEAVHGGEEPRATHLKALEAQFYSDDLSCELTIRDYLCMLLTTLWDKQADFNGKRPFGNSGWTREVYGALIVGGFISGAFDEDGYIDVIDDNEAEKFVKNLISVMCFA